MSPLVKHRYRKMHNLSATDEVVLDIVRINHDARIMQIIDYAIKERVGTLATIHKSLMVLAKRGLVDVIPDGKDKRTKIVKLALRGIRFMEKL